MLLLSQKSELEMFVELVYIDGTLKSKEKTLSFLLENPIKINTKLKVEYEDKMRQLAVFVLSSDNGVILLKIGVGVDDNLSY